MNNPALISYTVVPRQMAFVLRSFIFIWLLFLLPLVQASANDSDELRLIALDVGEGQAVLLQRGSKGILIDTGHAGMAKRVLDKLEAYGIENLDYLVLTHLHPDHASGYFRLREAFPTTPLLSHQLPFSGKKQPDMVRWVKDAIAKDSYTQIFRAHHYLEWEGVTVKALWPSTDQGRGLNDNSLVLEVHYGPYKGILMGDVGTRVETQLINQKLVNGPYEVLIAGHHGSDHTSSEAFLRHSRPGFSIVSTNANNHRGYPSKATMQRLKQHTRKRVFTTYKDGDICLSWQQDQQPPRLCQGTPH